MAPPNVDESVVDHYVCSQWMLQTLLFPLVIPRLTEEAVKAKVAEDKPGEIPPSIREHPTVRYSLLDKVKCPVHVLSAKQGGSSADVNIIFFHGGAFISSFISQHVEFAVNLMQEVGVQRTTVYLVEYPHAPKVNHETLLDTVEDVYRAIVASASVEGKKVVLMGDSSGGGIALLLAQKLSLLKRKFSSHVQRPDCVLLLSPWLDVGLSANPVELALLSAKDPLLDVAGLRACGRMLANIGGPNQVELDDPRVSPLFGDLEGLPPVSVWIGSHDLLLTDSRRLRDKYRRTNFTSAPSRIRYREKTGSLHCFFLFPFHGTTDSIKEMADAIVTDCGLSGNNK